MEKDIVLDIKNRPFGARNIAEKREIIRAGRPTPSLKTKVGTRTFQIKWYEQIDWLCASSITEKLYCWPCLLFQPKANQSWTDGGYNNYKNILSDCKYHSKSVSHLSSYKGLKTFGQYDIVTVISESAKLEKQLHNKAVEENRQYIKHLTNAVLYLCKQELLLRGHDEGSDNLNRGNYRELLQCFAEIDSVFASRLSTKEGTKQFSGVSSAIQNDLIQAIGNVISDEIRSEVDKAPFMSVQADETTDCAMHAQLSIIIRYVYEDKICERFLGFYEISDDKSATRLADVIATALNSFNDATDKLVRQTYDGAAVMAGTLNGVQSKLRDKGFKHAHFIHCYAHKLNLVLSKSAEKVKNHCSSEKWDEDTLCQADNLLAKLNDFTFMFFINCFDNILSQAGKLFDILQCKLLDIKYGQSKLNYFIHCVEGYRKDEHYENILRDTAAVVEQADEFDPPPRKKARGAQIDYKITYFTIIDNILMSLRERFSGMQEYAFFGLLDVKFEEFANSFPMQHMDCLKNKYPGIFDCKSLVNELKYMYIDSDLKKCKSINTILELLYKLELTSAMPESIKLIKLLLTIPLTSVANERSFSTLNRIRSYLRSTMSQERLSSLARISIEKSILNDLDNKKELHDRILQEFAIKPRRLEFMYK
ncbi:zinc finger MYM-type protein 1-like [Oratosquilla oratoria]|uniref:zinc finger MYM-type protein 1-like n=1 Tax=Oratosquilla oratoria TaxID=337810 RepID=UPI003F75B3EE